MGKNGKQDSKGHHNALFPLSPISTRQRGLYSAIPFLRMPSALAVISCAHAHSLTSRLFLSTVPSRFLQVNLVLLSVGNKSVYGCPAISFDSSPTHSTTSMVSEIQKTDSIVLHTPTFKCNRCCSLIYSSSIYILHSPQYHTSTLTP